MPEEPGALSSLRSEKQKRITLKKFLIFFWRKFFLYISGWNFPAPIRKTFLCFSKKNFLIFWERTFDSQSWKTTKKLLWKNFLYFSEKKIPVFLDFGIELSSPKPEKQKKIAMKKFLIFFWKKVFSFILQLNFPAQIPSFFQFYNFFFLMYRDGTFQPQAQKTKQNPPWKSFLKKKFSPRSSEKSPNFPSKNSFL